MTSNINFWRPTSNLASIFDVQHQIFDVQHQILMLDIKYWRQIWRRTSKIDVGRQIFDLGRQKLMLDVKNRQIDVQHQILTSKVNIWCFRCFTPLSFKFNAWKGISKCELRASGPKIKIHLNGRICFSSIHCCFYLAARGSPIKIPFEELNLKDNSRIIKWPTEDVN